jgi:glutamate synthase domain-containing protein 2
LLDGLAFAVDTLRGYDLKKDIKVVASGKLNSSFSIARALALGADLCSSARAMMLAVGCIQALQCNTNTCPAGVATQDPELMKGLDVQDKSVRMYNYHKNTMKSFAELISAAGLVHHSEIDRSYINLRVSYNKVLRYDELYPEIKEGSYLERMKDYTPSV